MSHYENPYQLSSIKSCRWFYVNALYVRYGYIYIYWISFQDIQSDMFSNFSLLCLRPCLGWRVAFWAKSRNSAAQHVLTRTQQMSRFRWHTSNTSMSPWQLLNARGTCKGPAKDSQGTHEELPKETPRDSHGTHKGQQWNIYRFLKRKASTSEENMESP